MITKIENVIQIKHNLLKITKINTQQESSRKFQKKNKTKQKTRRSAKLNSGRQKCRTTRYTGRGLVMDVKTRCSHVVS